jgi:murein DD-endopeptidase MepM/ murein hydrolase activator NlpD
LARHRSPHGAQVINPDRAAPLAVGAALGPCHLPAPPASVTCARVTVAAVAAGAAIAAGESLVGAEDIAGPVPLPVSAVLPVVSATPAESGDVLGGVGGDQPLPDSLTAADLDPLSQVDIQGLTKAVDIGKELARQAAIVEAALADGASDAVLVGNRAYVRPVVGRLTSAVGPRWGGEHYGLDIANRIGTPIFAVTDGVVEESGPASGFGLWVVLRHPDGTKSLYGHINRTFVEVGQRVRAGEQIAEVGNRGISTGPHLHLEIWGADGAKLDPGRWLRRRGIDV